MRDLFLKSFVFVGVFVLFTACGAPAPATPLSPTETSWQAPSQTASPRPTLKPTLTLVPTVTSIPGFEGWSVVNPAAVGIQAENGSLILTLKRSVLWFRNERGVLLYKPVSGDFKITADVHTAKTSDPSQPPGGDGSVQLGGLMARKGNGGKENYVFIVVGDDGDGLSIETKTTLDNESDYEGPRWDSPDAELRLCRVGQTFNLYKRHVGTREAWTLAKSFDRADLPQELQVGMNIYTNAEPDLQVRYDHIAIEPVSSESDCKTD